MSIFVTRVLRSSIDYFQAKTNDERAKNGAFFAIVCVISDHLHFIGTQSKFSLACHCTGMQASKEEREAQIFSAFMQLFMHNGIFKKPAK